MVFGQMKEPPGARFLVGLAALSVAEYFRDVQQKDVLFLVDNVYRHVQAGMEVSGLLGRLPSRVGYQPTLAADIAALEERITATEHGDMVSVQAVYVPTNDSHLRRACQFGRACATLIGPLSSAVDRGVQCFTSNSASTTPSSSPCAGS